MSYDPHNPPRDSEGQPLPDLEGQQTDSPHEASAERVSAGESTLGGDPSAVAASSNLYQVSGAGEASVPVMAEVAGPTEAASARGPSRPPQPHLGFAILWMIGLLAAQLVVAVVFTVLFMLGAVATGTPLNELGQLEGTLSLVLVPVATGTTVASSVLICLVVFGRRFPRRIGWTGLSPVQLLLVLLCVLPMAVVASEVTNWASYFLPQFGLSELMAFGESFWPLVFVAGCLFPGLGEEIFFRGFLGRGLLAWHGLVPGILLTSLLFGVIHVEPIQACGAFVLGLGMHYVFLTTRSLLAPITLHTLNNALAFGAFRWREQLPIPGFSSSGGEAVAHTDWYVLLAAVVSLILVLAVLRKTQTRWQLPDGRSWSPGYPSGEAPDPELGAQATLGRLPIGLMLLTLASSAGLVAALWQSHLAAVS